MIKKYVTNSVYSYTELETPDFSSKQFTSLPTIQLDSTKQYQQFLGFGVSLTDASCYMVNQLPAEKRTELIEDIYTKKGLNLSVSRLNVGASDYATHVYSYNDTKDDFDMKDFSIDADKEYLIPVVKEVLKANPDLYLFSSPWSPPSWMKTGGQMCGGWMRHKYLEAFTKYYCEYLKAYAKEGISIQALTSQNEPETDQISRMPASYLHPEFEAELVEKWFPKYLKEYGLDTKVWLLDHNYLHWNRVKWMLDEPEVKANTGGIAFHPYEGTPSMMTTLHNFHPEVEIHLTETGPSYEHSYADDWCRWGQSFSDTLNNWCTSYTGWNLALDEYGCPNVGPFKCGGLVTINSQTLDITYSGQYKAFKHFSRHIERNSVRIHASSEGGSVEKFGITYTAFQNPNGEIVLQIVNPKERNDIQIEYKGEYLRIALHDNSISTIIFN